MIVDSMTHSEVYRELDKDIAEVAAWWSSKRKMLEKIAKWTTKLPFERWYEYTSTRQIRYLVLSRIMGRNYDMDGLTCLFALRKMDRGWAIYVTRFPWQRLASRHVILPHFFDQYANPERGNVRKTGIELIKHFIAHNNHGEVSRGDQFSGRSVRYEGRDNICKSVNDGVMMGEEIDGVFVVHTFITYEMAGSIQREEFDKNREKIMSDDEFRREFKKGCDEEVKMLKEQVITEIMREREQGKKRLIQVK